MVLIIAITRKKTDVTVPNPSIAIGISLFLSKTDRFNS